MEALFRTFDVLCHSSTDEEREEAKRLEKLGMTPPEASVEYRKTLININLIEGVVPSKTANEFLIEMVSGGRYVCKGKIKDYFD